MLQPLLGELNRLRIILASSSPQRKHILQNCGLKFEVVDSNFNENLEPQNYSFSEYVEETALGKLQSVLEQLKDDEDLPDIIIGVDTMVTFNGKMYGKPKSRNDAINVLKKLTCSTIPNVVYTGVVIKYKNRVLRFTEVTNVYMKDLSNEEIEAYVDTGEPMGKAGGYGIQGIASSFIERIDGDYNNVIGLPLCTLAKKLKELMST